MSLRVLSDHVVPATWPPRVQSAINTDCVVTGEDGADTSTTLANVGVAIGAGNERGWILSNVLPGYKLPKEARGDQSLLRRLSSVLENPHRFHVSTARPPAKLAGGRNVSPMVIAPEVSRVPVTLVLGMFACIVAAGNDLSTCRLTKEQFLIRRVQVSGHEHHSVMVAEAYDVPNVINTSQMPHLVELVSL